MVKIEAAKISAIGWILASLLLAGTVGAAPPAFLAAGSSPVEGGLQNCTGFNTYQQPLDATNFGNALTSDTETPFLVAEDFVDSTGTIAPLNGFVSGLRWWGFSIMFPAARCIEDINTPFDIKFWDDRPAHGNVVCQATGVVPTIMDTGIPFAFFSIEEYTARFPDCDATGATWVSIQRQIGVTGCVWVWVNENLVGSYDDLAWQDAAGPRFEDLSVCVQGSPLPQDIFADGFESGDLSAWSGSSR